MENKTIPIKDLKSLFREKPWDITPDMRRNFSEKKNKENLDLFNQINESRGYFFMLNYAQDKLYLGHAQLYGITGYSSTYIESMSRSEFYTKILKPDEFEWYYKMIKQARDLVYQYPTNSRKNLELNFDLLTTTATNIELTLRHKIVPYKFDKNDNLWLGLGYVSHLPSSTPQIAKAVFTNSLTGEQYIYKNDKFFKTTIKTLTYDEILILKWTAEDKTSEQMCDVLHISESSFKRKRKQIFEKLNVQSTAAAVYKASSMGII
jgi:DNA-binding CsgD family transcriptional regulator